MDNTDGQGFIQSLKRDAVWIQKVGILSYLVQAEQPVE